MDSHSICPLHLAPFTEQTVCRVHGAAASVRLHPFLRPDGQSTHFMDRPPLCPQLRTLGLSPPSAVPCLLGKAEEWNHWVVRHFCVYLLKKWQHHSLIRYFLFLFLKFQLITLFDCTGSLLRRGNSWLRMWFPDRDQTRAPALGGCSLNLWTTREVLILFLISLRLLFPLTA